MVTRGEPSGLRRHQLPPRAAVDGVVGGARARRPHRPRTPTPLRPKPSSRRCRITPRGPSPRPARPTTCRSVTGRPRALCHASSSRPCARLVAQMTRARCFPPIATGRRARCIRPALPSRHGLRPPRRLLGSRRSRRSRRGAAKSGVRRVVLVSLAVRWGTGWPGSIPTHIARGAPPRRKLARAPGAQRAVLQQQVGALRRGVGAPTEPAMSHDPARAATVAAEVEGFHA